MADLSNDPRPEPCRKCGKPKEYNRLYRIKGVHCNCGRPPKWATVEEFSEAVEKYFIDCDKKNLPYTKTSLAVFLETDKNTIADFMREKNEFSGVLKTALQRIEAYAERLLFENRNPAGVIFNLCNNFKSSWQNSQRVDNTVSFSLKSALQEADRKNLLDEGDNPELLP